MSRFTIVTSSFENCLSELISHFSTEEQETMQVEEGYHSKLTIDEEVWNSLTDKNRADIHSYAGGFVQGYEYREFDR